MGIYDQYFDYGNGHAASIILDYEVQVPGLVK